MAKYSEDEAVEATVLAAEAEYLEAQDALRADRENPELVDNYHVKRDEFDVIRKTVRSGRAMAVGAIETETE